MENRKQTSYTFGDLTLLYYDSDGVPAFTVLPASMQSRVCAEKLKGGKPMVQLSFAGEVGEREYFAGLSMQNGAASLAFRQCAQVHEKTAEGDEVVTTLQNGAGQTYIHRVRVPRGTSVAICSAELKNDGAPVTVEMLASVSIGAISPFCARNDADALKIYRMRTAWSGEGKLDVCTAAQLQLEDVWSGSYGLRQDRIGQVGSMPCRKFLPFYAVEDTAAGCVWAMRLEAPASWQIDAMHYHGSLSLTGGMADFESGHWRKTLAPGESLCTHAAFVTAVEAHFEQACAVLQKVYARPLDVPAADKNLPVLYNEYCQSWGKPRDKQLRAVVDECAALGLGIFVVDCGWWLLEDENWSTLGDWNESRDAFPDGFAAFARYVRSRGMVPGVWFEFEAASTDSKVFNEHRDWCLTRDGHTIVHRERALLDFRKPQVQEYAAEKVIRFLQSNDVGYMKVDYNEGLGIGCDGAESYGEGMRRHVECVLEFMRRVKREVPGLILEICSSGGHRLEPAFLGLAAQASFSDAHLEPDGAVIAADLHRYMLPRQMQVWATLNPKDSLARTAFTLAKGMLGRMCLSGDLLGLNAEQKQLVQNALRFYKKCAPILDSGDTRINYSKGLTSLVNLQGIRTLVRFSADGEQALFYAFGFGRAAKSPLTLTEPALKDYDVADYFTSATVARRENTFEFSQPSPDPCLAAVLLLQKKNG